MSEWTHVKGTHTSKKASIKKILKTVLEYNEYSLECDKQQFDFSFDSNGIEAAKKIEKIIEYFKSYDSNSIISMNVEIMFWR